MGFYLTFSNSSGKLSCYHFQDNEILKTVKDGNLRDYGWIS